MEPEANERESGMSGVSGEFFRATGSGYGVGQNDDGRAKYLKKHRALCNGYMCEERECEAGQKWRSTRSEAKWQRIDQKPTEETT